MTAVRATRSAGIITPEAVVLEFETAGVASRMLARLIDGVVLWFGLLSVALMIPLAVPDGSAAVGIILLVVFIFFVLFGYWIVLETLWRGRTLGKAAMGLRVVTVEGAPVRLRHSSIRALVGFVDFLLPPLAPVAVLSVLFSRRDQRLGDLAAGTIVLRERSVGGPVVPLMLFEPPAQADLMASLALAPIPEPQYAVVRRFLLRVTDLHPDARADIAWRLASAIEASTGVARPPLLHPEWYLHAAGLVHQRRFAPRSDSRSGSGSPPPPAGPMISMPLPPPPPTGSVVSAPLPPPPLLLLPPPSPRR